MGADAAFDDVAAVLEDDAIDGAEVDDVGDVQADAQPPAGIGGIRHAVRKRLVLELLDHGLCANEPWMTTTKADQPLVPREVFGAKRRELGG